MDSDCRVVISAEAESYAHSLPGLELDIIRTGVGSGSNTVRTALFDDATFGVASVGFPVRVGTTLSDDYMIAVVIDSAPPRTRWSGYDLESGDLLLYGPGAEHTAVSPIGVGYSVAIVRHASIAETAEDLHTDFQVPAPGSVQQLRSSSSSRSLRSAIGSTLFTSAADGQRELARRNVLQVLASELPGDADRTRVESMSISESRRIVRRCFEFVHEQGGAPSIASLCDVAHVSERRLRSAFIRAYGQPPIAYFRDLRLNAARDRLLVASNKRQTVTGIAMDLGFEHGGRFSHRYFELFGELPSATLQTAS